MGVFDKFLNIMKLDGEDDYDEFDEYDDDDDYEDEPSRKSFFKKKDKDYDYDLEEEIAKEPKSAPAKITSFTRKRGGGNSMEVCVIKPTTFEDSREITETLLSGRAVVLNFEGLDVDLAPVSCTICCSNSGFSSIGHGLKWLWLNG